MQQKINPENENERQRQNKTAMKYKILKAKGKPFWLNLSQSRSKIYQKYKSQSQPQLVHNNKSIPNQFINSTHTSSHQTQLIQSVSSFNQNYQQFKNHKINHPNCDHQNCTNQNYDQDFQSYKSTINIQKHIINKNECQRSNISLMQKNKSQQKGVNIKINRLQLNPISSPQRKLNKIKTNSKIRQKINKNISRVKTQKSQLNSQQVIYQKRQQKQYQTIDIQKQFTMYQNTMYLRSQNQKMIRKIQQMRKYIPLIIKNQQQIYVQKLQLNQLKQKIYKATAYQYQYQLQHNKSQISLHKKHVENKIKQLNSPKNEKKKQRKILNDDFSLQINNQQKIRQQLMCKLRIHCLREQKSINLQKKIKLYQQIISKIQTKERLKSSNDLERRKIFLQWDVQRMKNEIDLKIIQQQVQIQSIKQQLQLIDQQIKQKQKVIVNNNQSKQNSISKKNSIHQKQILKLQPLNHSFQKLQQKTQNETKSLILKRKNILQSPKLKLKPLTELPFVLANQLKAKDQSINQQQSTIYDQQTSIFSKQTQKLPFFNNPQNLRHKIQLEKSNKNINLRIKKCNFRQQNISEQLEELNL